MDMELDLSHETLPPGYKRFFSGGNIDELRKHLDGASVDFGKLWIRVDEADASLKASARYTFIREEIALKDKQPFSEKVVITGIVPEKRIKTTGGMNDEVDYIEGPVQIDGIYQVSGEYLKPTIRNITSQYLIPNKSG